MKPAGTGPPISSGAWEDTCPVVSVARAARAAGVRRLVFAHIGRPTQRVLVAGGKPPLGQIARDGQLFLLRESSQNGDHGG